MLGAPGGPCVGGSGSIFGVFRNSEGWFKNGATRLALNFDSSYLGDLGK